MRIINRPKRYISRQMLSQKVSLEELKSRYAGKDWVQERIDKLIYDLNSIKDMAPFAAVNYIRYAVGYDRFLMEYARDRRLKEEDLLEVASELQDSAADHKTFEEWFDYIRDYGEKLLQQSRRRERETGDGVVLSTMHSAKGLEYDRVFLIDANEGVTPHKKAVMEADVEEERRMFYVAMTRAKQKLYIYFTKERYHKPASMSRFVGELLADRSLFKTGAKVVHRTYGPGTITNITQTAVTILFTRSQEIKTLNLSFCISNGLLKLL